MKHPDRLQCKDIPDEPILRFLAGLNGDNGEWGNWCRDTDTFMWQGKPSRPYDRSVLQVMPPDLPDNLVLAKMRQLIHRGLVTGCACGCRGDFTITEKGRALLAKEPTP